MPPLLMVGAGLSAGLVPTADEFALEVADRRLEVEATLGVSSGPPFDNADGLYRWADHCIASLGTNDAKMQLANALGLTIDRRFLAQEGVSQRGTTPRHRVLARLTREGRVRAAWSFNWDCWLEACFDAVGMRRYAGAQPSMANVGWMTRYHVWFNAGQPESATDCQPLFKSHGCVKAIHDGKSDFVIAKSEMDKGLSEQNSDRRNELRRQINLPGGTVSIGWKATEKYVVELFECHKPPDQLALKGELTVIDLDPSQDGHQRIASSYPTAPHRSVVVQKRSPGTADDLMLWIQTVRGLRTMKIQLPTDRQSLLDDLESHLPAYTDTSFQSAWIVSFFDDWLPVWLRNCCLAGAQLFGIPEGKHFQVLPSDRRDAHIPWCNPPSPRQDLQGALRLLVKLQQLHSSSPLGSSWDLDTFPGALWDAARGHLVLPVPIWASTDVSARATLKPLLESIHWQSKARIFTAAVLPLHCAQPETAPSAVLQGRLRDWQEAIASCFSHAALAQAAGIHACTLDELTLPSSMA